MPSPFAPNGSRLALALLASLPLAACSTLATQNPVGPEPPPGEKPARFHVEVVTTDQTFDELELRPDFSGSIPVRDLNRTRTAARVAFGGNAVRGYLQGILETFEDDISGAIQGGELDGGIGFGGGVVGDPVVGQAGSVLFLIPYRAGINWVALDNDVVDVLYFELEAEAAFGVEFFGVRISGGAYSSSIYGAYDTNGGGGADGDIVGDNIGYFFEGRYKHAKFPMYIEVRTEQGDVEQDFGLVIGATF